MTKPGARLWRVLLLCLWLCSAAAASQALADGWSLYDRYADFYTVPYVTPFDAALRSSRGALSLKLSLNGSGPRDFTMDTGSTGLAVASASIPSFTRSGARGWVFYNSSGLLLQGYFNTIPVSFVGAVDAAGRPVNVTALCQFLGSRKARACRIFPTPVTPAPVHS